MSSRPEPVIWSRDTGQRIPCFDRCQLTNIKDVRCLLCDYVRDVARRRRRRRAHAIHDERVVCFSISMHACGSVRFL